MNARSWPWPVISYVISAGLILFGLALITAIPRIALPLMILGLAGAISSFIYVFIRRGR